MRCALPVLAALAFSAGLASAGPTADASPTGVFGTLEFRAESHAALPKWDAVLQGIAGEEALYLACADDHRQCANRGAMAWQALLTGLNGAAPQQQLRQVNRFFNQIEYKADDANFGISDYWATPLEFIAMAGDCEDYVIAKYVSLRRLGFPADSLRMVVVEDTLRDLAHAVLAVYVEDRILILDNLTDAVLEHDRIFQYRPYYSVNENARWAHVVPGGMFLSSAAH